MSLTWVQKRKNFVHSVLSPSASCAELNLKRSSKNRQVPVRDACAIGRLGCSATVPHWMFILIEIINRVKSVFSHVFCVVALNIEEK